MMNIRKTTLLFSLSLALFVAGLSFAGSQQASAAYNGGRIMDNGVFLDANSMNAAQIQSFLASKGSGLASRSFVLQCYGANSQERQLYTSVGAACDQNMSAANIIYYASRIYGINPQVIMATLQKEQSLITTGNPTSWQLNQAMGYGCPTTGNCSGNSTFSYQIDSGTWVLRYHYERANGNNAWWSPSTTWVCGTEKNFYKPNLYPGQNVRFYDGNNVLYRTHFIENAATSSFYCYTPHAYNNPQGLYGRPAFGTTGQYYSGSYNFVSAFEEWFGSTDGGDLVRTPSNGQVYIVNIDNGMKYPINNMDVLNDYSALRLRFVSDSFMSQYTTGQAVGNMAQSPDGTLSLITASIKLPFSSCSGDIVDYGYTCASNQFIPLTAVQSNKLANGPGVTKLIKSNTNATIYYMDAGKKRPIASWSDLLRLQIPISWNVLSSSTVNSFQQGTVMYGPGSLVRTTSSATIYAVKNSNTLMTISNFSFPQELGLSTNFRFISDVDFQTTYNSGAGAAALTNKVSCGGVNYVGIGGRLYDVSSTSIMNAYGFSSGEFTDLGSICPTLPPSTPLSQYLRGSNGTIYYVAGGTKRAFSSYSTYQSSSYCNNTCSFTQATSFFVNSIPTGTNL